MAGSLGELVLVQDFVEARTVKADHDVAANIQHRNAGLARFLHSGNCVLSVQLDIAVVIFDAQLVHVVHGFVAKCAPFGAVYNHCCFVITHIVQYSRSSLGDCCEIIDYLGCCFMMCPMADSHERIHPEQLARQAVDIIDATGDVRDEPQRGKFNLVEDAIYTPRSSFISETPVDFPNAEYRGGTVPVVRLGEIAVRRNWPSLDSGYLWYEDGKSDHKHSDYYAHELAEAKARLGTVQGNGMVHIRTASWVVGERDDYSTSDPNPGFTALSVSEIRRYGGDPHTQYRFNLTCSIGGAAVSTRIVHQGRVQERGGTGNWESDWSSVAVYKMAGADPTLGGLVFASPRRDDFDFSQIEGALATEQFQGPLNLAAWSALLDHEPTTADILRIGAVQS